MEQPILAVTGGSSGIGAAIAMLAAQRGYDVAFTYLTAHDAAERVARQIEHAGRRAVAVQADATDQEALHAFFREVDEKLGRLTALVNNAGITGSLTTLDNVGVEDIDRVLHTNVRGVFVAIREAIARMATDLGGPGGAIVNISSRAAELGGAGEWVHYAASKGAVDTLTVGAARELAKRGIRVNAVSPGLIETAIHAKAGDGGRVERLGAMTPLGHAGSAQDVAYAVLWLLSEEAAYVTGANLPVSGGR